jgi:hypothetical protein
MNVGTPRPRIYVVVLLSMLAVVADGQMTGEAAHEQAASAVRTRLHLKPGQYLNVQRNEKVEELLATAVGRPGRSEFIYDVNQEGDEFRGEAVIHHVFTDGDLRYIVAINATNGTTYYIHGFADSLPEFEKLITEVGRRVFGPEDAESLAEFYRAANPENLPLDPISSLIELKQAAERQCLARLGPFDAGERAFADWWGRAKPLYAEVSFRHAVALRGAAYRVEWIVLSSAALGGTCGGVPLRARLDVGSDGHVSKVIFAPLRPLSLISAPHTTYASFMSTSHGERSAR